MKNKSFYLYTGIILSILILSGIVGLVIYSYWKESGIDDEIGYNSINAVIALLSLAFGILTVIFVFATYQSSIKQIQDNKKNIELDRALNNIYRQLEFTRQNYSAKLDKYRLMLDKLNNATLESLFYNIHGSRRFLDDYSSELERYVWIIEKTSLSWEEKSFLLNIVFKNYSEIIKKLYHKLYSIKVFAFEKNIYKEITAFYTNYYAREKSKIDPDFAALAENEKDNIIKAEMKDKIATKVFTLQIVYEKLDLIKKIENNYQIIRPNVVYPKKQL